VQRGRWSSRLGRRPYEAEVAGSNPARPTKKEKGRSGSIARPSIPAFRASNVNSDNIYQSLPATLTFFPANLLNLAAVREATKAMAEALIEEARRELVRTFEVLARRYGYTPERVAAEPAREEPEALDPQELLGRLEDFRKFCEVDLSLQRRTVEGYVGRVRVFLQWCRASGMPASTEAVREFLSHYEAANSRANYLKAFRRFFRDFLGREDIIKSFKLPRPEIPIQPVLELPSREELRRFFEALPSLRYKAAFLIYASSGLRAKELTELRFKDVDLERRMINATKLHKGRTKRGWITFYSKEAAKWLKKYIEKLPPEQRTPESRIFPVTRHSVIKAFWKAEEKTGLKITPQVLREWFCQQLADAGVPERYIDAFCGRVPATVIRRHYSDYKPENLERIYKQAEKALKILP